MKLHVIQLEDYLDQNGTFSLIKQNQLMKLRRNGDMVCLVTDYSRTKCMRTYYALANVFISDGGSFAFSGCSGLYDNHLEVLPLKQVCEQFGLSYTFEKEDDSACGGRILLDQNHAYIESDYTMRAKKIPGVSLEQLQDCLKEYCIVKENEEEFYFLPFKHIEKEALQIVVKSLDAEVVEE